MKLVGHHTSKELRVPLAVWGILMVMAIAGLLYLRSNALRIIENIHYVDVSRGDKALVLYAEAEKHARQVLEKAEEMNRLSGRKYVVPKNDENLVKSVELLNKALDVDLRDEFSPERTMYYELLGQVHDAAGNRAEQLGAHTRAMMAQRDVADAADFIRVLREVEPQSPEPILLQAQLHLLSNDTSSALTALDELYTSYTVTPKARWVKGQLLTRVGDVENAAVEIRQAIEQRPENLTYRRDLANLLANKEKKAEAVEVLRGGMEHGAWYDAAYLHTYGNYLTDTGKLDEAIRVLKQADELAPYSGDVQWSLAKAYHEAGKPKLAASALRRATEIRPELHEQIF